MAVPEFDYLPHFVSALSRRNVPKQTITAFDLFWRSLPQPVTELPCPFCFAAGKHGRMVEQTIAASIMAMGCTNCGEQVFVRIT